VSNLVCVRSIAASIADRRGPVTVVYRIKLRSNPIYASTNTGTTTPTASLTDLLTSHATLNITQTAHAPLNFEIPQSSSASLASSSVVEPLPVMDQSSASAPVHISASTPVEINASLSALALPSQPSSAALASSTAVVDLASLPEHAFASSTVHLPDSASASDKVRVSTSLSTVRFFVTF
jgi:hypothetical protein